MTRISEGSRGDGAAPCFQQGANAADPRRRSGPAPLHPHKLRGAAVPPQHVAMLRRAQNAPRERDHRVQLPAPHTTTQNPNPPSESVIQTLLPLEATARKPVPRPDHPSAPSRPASPSQHHGLPQTTAGYGGPYIEPPLASPLLVGRRSSSCRGHSNTAALTARPARLPSTRKSRPLPPLPGIRLDNAAICKAQRPIRKRGVSVSAGSLKGAGPCVAAASRKGRGAVLCCALP